MINKNFSGNVHQQYLGAKKKLICLNKGLICHRVNFPYM